MPAFGRRIEFDEASRQYPIRALLGPPPRTLQTRIWPCDVHLDQNGVGACVGYSWAAELAAEPEIVHADNAMGLNLYYRAQELDQWDDTPPQEGSSVLAGAKAVQELGWLLEYRWAFGLDDLLDTLSQFGPAVLGINWRSAMMNTDHNGYIHYAGEIVGGHAILAVGVDPTRQSVLLHNSWGPDWGINGDAWILFAALDAALHENGEACIPVTRTHISEPVPIPDEPVEPEPEPEPTQPAGCLTRQTLRPLFRRTPQ